MNQRLSRCAGIVVVVFIAVFLLNAVGASHVAGSDVAYSLHLLDNPVKLVAVGEDTRVSTLVYPNGSYAEISLYPSTYGGIVTYPNITRPWPWFVIRGAYLTGVYYYSSIYGATGVIEVTGTVPSGAYDVALVCQLVETPPSISDINVSVVAGAAPAVFSYQYIGAGFYDTSGGWAWYGFQPVASGRWNTYYFYPTNITGGHKYYFCIIYYVYPYLFSTTFDFYLDYASVNILSSEPFFSGWIIAYNNTSPLLNYTGRGRIVSSVGQITYNLTLVDLALYTDAAAVLNGSTIKQYSGWINITEGSSLYVSGGILLSLVADTAGETGFSLCYNASAGHIACNNVAVSVAP